VDVHAGRINPRIAAALAPLLNLQLRANETTDLERLQRRIEELEKQPTKGPGNTSLGDDGDAQSKGT
jgi:hypothetical protein